MECRDLERRLEALAARSLAPVERARYEEHLAACAACRELLELARLEPPPGVGDDAWVDGVLARTSRAGCAAAEAALCDLIDGRLPAGERRQVASHLAGCGDCAALASVLAALAAELPRLADLRPDDRFVDDVLARTLPVAARVRRFWERAWPRWVRRPRFASEVAYVGVLVVALVVATPGSPLADAPGQALATVRADPRAGLAAPVAAVEDRIEGALERLAAGRTAAGWRESGRGALATARTTAGAAGERISSAWGTLRGEIASLLGKAGEPVPEPAESGESIEEAS
ncbi:MAG: zf-HC2 domain-containing protein [Acidobacteriota bacterium]|nr:zf-HC2 domain-containing protein [Acidobacteriota bacterium]MDH3524843.1 zf-HC2 domain-containing protein [Acidobacteriota bacterium]